MRLPWFKTLYIHAVNNFMHREFIIHTHQLRRCGGKFNPTVMDLPPTESPITKAITANGSANHNNGIMV